jgi:two-component system chemotaxis response regulator CheB
MPQPKVVIIGASAGGLPPLTAIVERLPPGFPACVLVVMHTRSDSNGVLPLLLNRVSPLPVAFAEDHDVPADGRIYVARPDLHLLAVGNELRVLHGPRENGFRPAIDPLLRTAARAWGSRVIGVILSGALDDGTNGLSVVKAHGGTTIAQDPDEATIDSMPRSAIETVGVDYVLRTADIASLLVQLGGRSAKAGEAMARSRELEPQLPSESTQVASMEKMYGPPSALTCPECGGSLWEIVEGRALRYQCHTGHRFSPDTLDSEQRSAVDSALWTAVRVLEEHADLKMRMARRAAAGGLANMSSSFEAAARDAHAQAQQISRVLFGSGRQAPPAPTASGGVRRRSGRPPARATAASRRTR